MQLTKEPVSDRKLKFRFLSVISQSLKNIKNRQYFAKSTSFQHANEFYLVNVSTNENVS